MPKQLRLPKKRTVELNASIIRRILAFIIDLLLINFVVAVPLRGVLAKLIPPNMSFIETYNYFLNNPSLNTAILWVTFALSILTLSYFTILEWKLGQTVGKMILKINVKSDYKAITIWQAFVRNLFLIPLFPFIALWIIDPLFMLFTKNNQRLMEILSKSKVVQHYEV